MPYDQLVLATGAKAVPAYRDALTFGEDPAEERLHGLLADLEQGYAKRVAFVVPGEAAWTLPLYEIALMTARQVWGMGIDGVQFTLVTPEERPLAMFGAAGERRGRGDARRRGHRVRRPAPIRASGAATWSPTPAAGASTSTASSRCRSSAGAALPGVPADGTGFIPVDAHGRVAAHPASTPRVTASTSRSSRAASRRSRPTRSPQAIAARAGADVEPEPFRPVLRGLLLTGGDDRYMRHAVAGGGGRGARSPATRCGGRRPRSPAGTSPATCSSATRRRSSRTSARGHLEVELPLDAHAAAGHP